METHSMEHQELETLIEKYLNGTASEAEKAYLEAWYAQLNEENRLGLSETEIQRTGRHVKKALFRRMNGDAGHRFPYRMLAGGIAALMIITAGFLFFTGRFTRAGVGDVADIAPGGNKAYLILGDGRQLNLDSAANGQIGLQSGSSIVKLSDGNISYQQVGNKGKNGPDIAYNTLEVPLGGQYSLTLPDGTKVWMNAGSSLKFPASFAQLSERRVFLKGEAYFEVFHDPRHPFYVKTEKQEAKVLGTHFNIEAYPESEAVKTTLLEGSLKVVSAALQDSCLLVPGRQAVLNGKFRVRKVDTDAVMDWKDGYFIFNRETVKDILTKIARWYNVQVIYKGNVENVRLDGIISKNTPLSEVLALLSATHQVSFEIRGKVLYVVK